MKDVCVVFDVDDTLYLERDYVASGFRAVGAWAACWLNCPEFADRCQRAFESGRRSDIFNVVTRELGLSDSPQLIATLVTIYRTHDPAIRLAQDAHELLESLVPDYPIAVITDGPMVTQSRKCEALSLRRYAHLVILTEMLGTGCSKPDMRAFKEVQRCIPARRYVYIGDNPAKDFAAPAALGWISIRVRRPGGLHFEHPDETPVNHSLPDCRDIPDLISRL